MRESRRCWRLYVKGDLVFVGKKPIIGITMGDPAGVGPEIVVKALNEKRIYELCRPVVIGDAKVLENATGLTQIPLDIHRITNPGEGQYLSGVMDVIDLENVDTAALRYGKVSDMCGRAAYEYVEQVIRLAMAGEIDATVTAPIHKAALNLAGYHYSGHTEIYAKLTGTSKYAMMLAHGDFRVLHVSTHVSLRRACELVKKDRIVEIIRLANATLVTLGIEHPRIGVAGLNPHAGDDGLFGDEEINEIVPAVDEMKAQGINVEGPIPADTLFSKARGGLYDMAIAMYHDQGHIPVKMAGFVWNEERKGWDSVSGINVTLGLPIIRTSVDHGVAFDIAWKGVASHESLVDAIKYAAFLAGAEGSFRPLLLETSF